MGYIGDNWTAFYGGWKIKKKKRKKKKTKYAKTKKEKKNDFSLIRSN